MVRGSVLLTIVISLRYRNWRVSLSNYPPGSMRGSGIYQTEMMIDVKCDAEFELGNSRHYAACVYEGTVEGIVNDYGTSGYWECPVCGSTYDFDVSDYKDEYYYEEKD